MQIDHSVANAPDRSVLKRHCLIESTDPDSQNATGIAGVFNDRVPIAESAVNGQHQWSKHGTIRLDHVGASSYTSSNSPSESIRCRAPAVSTFAGELARSASA